jgi:hypothetical protein
MVSASRIAAPRTGIWFGNRNDRIVALRQETLSPDGLTVTLTRAKPLATNQAYRLTVNGTTAGVDVSDLVGNLLDGDGNGIPGGIFRLSRILDDGGPFPTRPHREIPVNRRTSAPAGGSGSLKMRESPVSSEFNKRGPLPRPIFALDNVLCDAQLSLDERNRQECAGKGAAQSGITQLSGDIGQLWGILAAGKIFEAWGTPDQRPY